MSQVIKIGVLKGTHTDRVQPGDLITAEFMNAILARLDEIEDRLAKIEESQSTPTQPTFTMPTTFFPTLTFNPTFTLPTTLFPTLNTFFPTFSTFPTFTTFMPTFLTPTNIATGGFNTFIATLVQPGGFATLGMNPTLGGNVMNPTLGMNPTAGGMPSMGMSVDPSRGVNVGQPSGVSILPAGTAIFHEDTDIGALPGITTDQRTALNNAGFKTVKDVSAADPKAIAGALKTNVDNANVLIGISKNVIGR